MAKINDGTLRDWSDGDKLTSDGYEQDRELLRVAINDNDTRLGSVEGRTSGVEGRLTTAEGNIEVLQTTDETHNERISSLENQEPIQDQRLTDLEYNVTGTVVPRTFNELGMQNTTFDDIKLGYIDKQVEDSMNITVPAQLQALEASYSPRLGNVEASLAENATRIKNVTLDLKKDFGAAGDGIIDDTNAINQAIAYSYANNIKVFVPNGQYRFTSNLLIKGIFEGNPYNSSSVFLKDFVGNGVSILEQNTIFKYITVQCSNNVKSTDTGHGIVVGDGQSKVASASIVYANAYDHGGCGLLVRSANHLDVKGEFNRNKGDGVQVNDDTSPTDTNVSKYDINCTGNTGHGLNIVKATVNDIYAVCQGNSGYGVNLQYVHNRMFIYTEGNSLGGLFIGATAIGNQIFGKFIEGSPTIQNNYNEIYVNTTTSSTLMMPWLYGRDFNNPSVSVPAYSTVEFDSLTNVYGVTNTSAIMVNPKTALPSGLMINAYYKGSNQVTIRVANVTGVSITLPVTTLRINIIIN